MENKKTFGAYILRRRTELGMTQRELADRLFVTESAVSKWERGMSYPDITLIRSLCEILDVSEHELLTGSDDVEQRNSEWLAEKYLRLARRYRVIQYIVYGVALLACFISNLAVQHRLDWFFIVLFSIATAASLTLAPAIAAMHPKTECYKAPIALGCFLLSLELLLLTCCLYTGGDWFIVAGVSVLFGAAVLLLPMVMGKLPLPAALANKKASLWLLLCLALLLILLAVCAVYTGGGWLPVTIIAVIFGTGFFIFPVLLRQLPLPEELKSHKTLIFFAVETLLLFALVEICTREYFLREALPITLCSLVLPWGIMLICRYVRLNGALRASLCCLLSGAWVWLFPYCCWRFSDAQMYVDNRPVDSILWMNVDFLDWGFEHISSNVNATVIIAFILAAVVLFILGITKKRR